MKSHSLFLCLVCSIATLSLAPAHADNLGEMLEKIGLGAIIGTWVDADTKGEAITVTYSWRIENHALALSVKSPNGNSEALIGVDPKTGDAVHMSLDDRGGVSRGKWSEDDGVAILNIVRTSVDGEETKIRITHVIRDNKELVVGMKNVETDQGGNVTLVRKPE